MEKATGVGCFRGGLFFFFLIGSFALSQVAEQAPKADAEGGCIQKSLGFGDRHKKHRRSCCQGEGGWGVDLQASYLGD